MTSLLQFPGLHGLIVLSRRDGVDMRPTLLRVLTDLYIQKERHTADEERQFAELATRLFHEVDDATRAAVRARLSTYRNTPADVIAKLGLAPVAVTVDAAAESTGPATHLARDPAVPQPNDVSDISAMFQRALPSERVLMLLNLTEAPLRSATPISAARAAHAIEALEAAAFARDAKSFARVLGEALIVPVQTATQIVEDAGGEPLACAAKAMGMPSEVFQRVLLFLNPQIGSSIVAVYRLARLYDQIDERAALIMLAAWRSGSVTSGRAKHQTALYDGERHRARGTALRPAQSSNIAPGTVTPSRSFGER